MTTTAMTLFAFVALIVSWRCWKRTARASVRDCLFAMRDGWRRHYVENGLDMEDGAYAKVRDLINGMLRYTKDMRMIGFVYFSAHVDSDAVRDSATKMDACLANCDAKTRELANSIRLSASESVLIYMASTSLGFISATICMFVYLLPDKILSALRNCARAIFEIKPVMVECAALR